ncbi:DinB family protein [Flavobacteriaceae bacterium 3-367]|uniref:DinB family protein n=1 Tax=Eudoraea algarum TaxID=3417568 RepID=UPI003282F9FD
MFKSSIQTIEQFKEILSQLPEDCYTRPCQMLSEASIGQHTRHIIELYQCLLQGYDCAEVSYDKRKRDRRIEQELTFALDQLQEIQDSLERPDKVLRVNYDLDNSEVALTSNYFREVMYNLEHTIHHQALIKVGIRQFTDMPLPESFGVAPSTMQFRTQCAQ